MHSVPKICVHLIRPARILIHGIFLTTEGIAINHEFIKQSVII